jgi:preprotein translocase SecE subunit
MADSPKPKKRRIRAPQTVREKAQSKTSKAETAKPKKLGKVKKVIAWPFKKVAWPFKKAGKFLGRFRVFRFIAKVFKFLAKILLINYLISSWKELKLVTWPSRRESWRLTFAVLAFAIVFGALVATLDYGLSHLFKSLLLSKR